MSDAEDHISASGLDSFMPFFGMRFFQAVEGQDDFVVVGYLRLIWHYWAHEKCEGLVDDSEKLRRIARVEREDWDAAWAVLFDDKRFFKKGRDGLWHNKFADEKWAETVAKFLKRRGQTAAASKARWRPSPPPRRP